MDSADATKPKAKAAAAAGTLIRSNYRWVICGLLCLMTLILFMDRTNISIAAPAIIKEFGISKTQMGLVFSIFAWAYAIGNIPGGWLGDRYGPRLLLTLMVAFWSVMTMATAHALGLTSLLVIRFVFGLGEAGAFPTATRAMQYWYPKSERGFVNGATHSAALFATAIVPLVSVAIVETFGWRSLFHIFGLFGIAWCVLWYLLYRNRPEHHKSVSEVELAHIRGDLENQDGAANARDATAVIAVPWRKILTSPNMWFLAFSFVAVNYTTYFFYYWMPSYLLEHHHISLTAMGFLASLPMAAGAVGSLSGGILTDFVYRRTKNLKWSRRSVCIGATLGSALFIIPAGVSESPLAVVLFLSLSIGSVCLVMAPIWAVSMDISGGFSGSVSGVMNMVGQAGASLSPIVFGALAQNGYWVAPFYITAAVLVVAAAMWAFLINPERSVLER